jgi:TPR repeat protein
MTMLLSGGVTKLLVKLLLGLSVFFEEGKPLKTVRIAHEEVGYLNSYFYLVKNLPIIKNFHAETFWAITTAYGKGAFYSVAIILIIIIIYLLINSARWRRARVFVSYHHLIEDIATTMAEKLKNKHLNPIKLRFLESPEHDSLLDEVDTRISESDLVICIPGPKPSFVEYEVAMAFAKKKPLILVSTNEHLSRIPDTAKHGYPIVNLNTLDEGGWSSFCNFCLYVTGYNMALINMCLCVMSIFLRILVVFGLLYGLVFLIVIMLPESVTISRDIGMIGNAIPISVATLFVVTYLAFTSERVVVAKKLRRVIGRQKFDLSIAPTMLTYNLRRADVTDILFKGNVIADHEAKKEHVPFAAERTVVPLEIDNQELQSVLAEALGGDRKSQFRWGQLLYSGQGCPQDKFEASVWFRRAAEQGFAEAQYNLGLLFEKGDGVEQNYTRAAHWYLQAAEQGHALAQNSVAELFHEGRGVEQDYRVALKWYEAAAAEGVVSAAYNAGHIYLDGLHVKRDQDKARALFEQSAASNFTLANYALGVIYEDGRGVKKDKQKAKSFYELAAADGDTDAQKAVERLSKRFWQFWR